MENKNTDINEKNKNGFFEKGNDNGYIGGHINPNRTYWETYVKYFIKFFEGYAKYGIEFNAFTPQNEPYEVLLCLYCHCKLTHL